MRGICLALVALTLGALAVGQEQDRGRPLTTEDLWRLKRVGPPSISPDGKWAVVEVTSYEVKRNEASSQLWLLSTDGKTQRQLTTAPGRSSGPRWSPDGKQIAFLSKRMGDEEAQIYLLSPTGGEARRLSKMPMSPSALKWAPDGRTIYCIAWTWADTPDDESYRKKVKAEKESKVKALIIEEALYRYWDRWIADGKRPTIYAVEVATGRHRNVLTGTGMHLPPFEPSASDYDISPDGKEICFVADSLKKPGVDHNADLFTCYLEGKDKPRNLTKDNGGGDRSPAYSPDGRWIAFVRSTERHFSTDCEALTLYDRQTGAIRTIWDKDRSFAQPRWMPDSKALVGTVEDAGYVYLAKVMLEDGKCRADTAPRYTDGAVDVARQSGALVFLRTSFDLPPRVYAAHAEQKPIPIEWFNDKLVSQWKLGKVESVTFKGAGDQDVQMWVVYPPNFDPKKKWPLVQIVHGGPHVGITTAFSFRWNPQLWAAQGWVIGIVNFHGSSGFGKGFADSITGDLGTKPGIDVLKGTDWFEKQPWIDKTRMACAGASFGGYMMAWLNGHTDRFKAMVCHAGVYSYHSQMASDIVYSRERALGAFPWNDLERIDRQTAQRYSRNFKTPTLILHGERDFRVPVTHGLEYFMTLKLKGVPSRLVYFPDENHWILKPQNSLLWHREVFSWLEKFIGKGPTAQ